MTRAMGERLTMLPVAPLFEAVVKTSAIPATLDWETNKEVYYESAPRSKMVVPMPSFSRDLPPYEGARIVE